MQVQELSHLHNLIFKRSDLHFMTQIHILADENIPGLDKLCGDWASISTRPGRAICAEDLKNIDVLSLVSKRTKNQKKIILFLSRIETTKGIYKLLETFQNVLKTAVCFVCLFVQI